MQAELQGAFTGAEGEAGAVEDEGTGAFDTEEPSPESDDASGRPIVLFSGIRSETTADILLPLPSAADCIIVGGFSCPTLEIWDTGSGECVGGLVQVGGRVFNDCLAYPHPVDGTVRVASSGMFDGSVHIYSPDSPDPILSLRGHTEKVTHLYHYAHPSSGHPFLVSGSYDKTLRIWDGESGLLVRVIKGFLEGRLTELTGFTSADGHHQRIVAGNQKGTLWICDADSGKGLHVLKSDESSAGRVRCFRSSTPPYHPHILVPTPWHVRVWDGETGTLVNKLTGCQRGILDFAVYSDTRAGYDRVAAGDSNPRAVITVWGPSSGAIVCSFGPEIPDDAPPNAFVQRLAAYQSGGGEWRLAATYSDRLLRIWNPEEGRCLHAVESHPRQVVGLRVFETGEGRVRMVSSDSEKNLIFWDLGEVPVRTTIDLRAATKLG
jgi:WD40 repeat protein